MKGLVAVTLLILLILVALRDPSIGTDTENYLSNYSEVLRCACITDTFEIGFQFLVYIISRFSAPEEVYLFLVALFSVLILSYFVKRVCAKESQYITLSILIISPFFSSVLINGVRQGLAAMIIFLAGTYWDKNKIIFFVLLLLSVTIHKSSVLILPFLILMYMKVSVVYVVFLLISVLYGFGFTQYLVYEMSEFSGLDLYDRVYSYNVNAEYRRGVRLDFLTFFLLGVNLAFFLYYYNRERVLLFYPAYETLLKFYVVLVMPFLWLGWAAYSNRYAFYGFLITPVFYSAIVVFFRIHRDQVFVSLLYMFSVISLIGMTGRGIAF